MKAQLSKSVVKSLESTGKQYYVFDTKQRSLAVVVQPSGHKSYSLIAKRNGRTLKRSLGNVEDMSVSAARDKVADMLTTVVETGKYPPITFGELFAKRLAHVKPQKRTWQEDQRKFDRHLAKWSKRGAQAITQPDVERLFSDLTEKTGHVTANRMLSLIKAISAII